MELPAIPHEPGIRQDPAGMLRSDPIRVSEVRWWGESPALWRYNR